MASISKIKLPNNTTYDIHDARLSNYYTKTETYNQTEVNNLIGAINQFKYEIYASISAVTSPQNNVLYLIGPTGSGTDKYEEYVYSNNTWVKIGDTTIDLSNYLPLTGGSMSGVINYLTVNQTGDADCGIWFKPISGDNYGHLVTPNTPLTSSTKEWTLPDASGTIALTDDLNDYLPLAGGTMTGDIDFSTNQKGIKLYSTSTSWTSSDRTIPFSSNGDNSYIRYTNPNANTGLTYNPNTGALKAGSFVKRGGTSSQFLKADGSVDSNTYATIGALDDKQDKITKLYTSGKYFSFDRTYGGEAFLALVHARQDETNSDATYLINYDGFGSSVTELEHNADYDFTWTDGYDGNNKYYFELIYNGGVIGFYAEVTILSDTTSSTLTADFNRFTSGNTSKITSGLSTGAERKLQDKLIGSGTGQNIKTVNSTSLLGSGDITTPDTKNTAGSTDSSSKLFIIGATSQAANPQTYSQDTAYVGTDGHLYSNSKQVVNLSDTQALTNKTYNGYTLAAACAKGVVTSVDTSANLPTSNAVKTFVEGKGYVTTDTKNTAGSTNSTSKLFLVGATEQSANPQTYSNSTLYIDATQTLVSKTARVTNNDLYIGSASANQCHQQYDATNKCLKFIFD